MSSKMFKRKLMMMIYAYIGIHDYYICEDFKLKVKI